VRPGPEYWRYLEAVTALADSDEDFTTRALAGRLSMTPEALLRFQYERPDVVQWASEQVTARNRAMVAPLLRKCAALAQAGSAAHAALLIQFTGNVLAGAAGAGPNARVTLYGPLVISGFVEAEA
jgi:hypothetical protein